MRAAAIAFLLGVLGMLCLPAWPTVQGPQWLLLGLAAGLALTRPVLRPFAFLMAGALHAWLAAGDVLESRLPLRLEGEVLRVQGRVVTLPVRDAVRQRFRLRVDSVARDNGEPLAWGRDALVILSWYERRGRSAPLLTGGEHLRLRVKLKRPRGLVNPAGFDYERWLFAQGVAATGYVRESLSAPQTEDFSGLRLRAWLAARLAVATGEAPGAAVIEALSLGKRDKLDLAQWETLRATGTGHLVAISGLHVGMLSLLGFGAGRWLWTRHPALPRRLPAPRAAALASLVTALAYAALAGFTLPTQRALVMVAVVAVAIASRRAIAPSTGLAVALLLVLALDPLAPLSAGFWLSFTATAVLLFVVAGRRARARTLLGRLAGLQFAVALGLAPVALAAFAQQPLLAPLANLLAIPWTGWLVVPLALLGTALAAIAPALAEPVLWLGGWAATLMFTVLDGIAVAGAGLQLRIEPGLAAAGAAAVGAFLLLLPPGVRLRWLGVPWLLPLALQVPAAPSPGVLDVAVLDVGQGLAVLVRTSRHVLLYDAGPRFSDRFDTGSAVVLPYLRQLRRSRLDIMLLSHANADHTGGGAAVHAGVPAARVLHNEALEYVDNETCTKGERWLWDGYLFEILHPVGTADADNNGSCVLRVSGPGGSVLLPGDIEAAAERALLAGGDLLSADLLVVPHHGSRTSSTAPFLAAVRPSLAVFSTGYRNRYGFPVAAVQARLRRVGASLLNTGRDGAVLVRLAPGEAPLVRRLRAERRALWRAP